MRFATNLLWIDAALFSIFGLGFIVAPGVLAVWLTGGLPATSDAMTDMRATYGGMGLGVGLSIAFCARQRETIFAGLCGVVLILGAIALARTLGVIVEGGANAPVWGMLGLEVLFVSLQCVALKRLTG